MPDLYALVRSSVALWRTPCDLAPDRRPRGRRDPRPRPRRLHGRRRSRGAGGRRRRRPRRGDAAGAGARGDGNHRRAVAGFGRRGGGGGRRRAARAARREDRRVHGRPWLRVHVGDRRRHPAPRHGRVVRGAHRGRPGHLRVRRGVRLRHDHEPRRRRRGAPGRGARRDRGPQQGLRRSDVGRGADRVHGGSRRRDAGVRERGGGVVVGADAGPAGVLGLGREPGVRRRRPRR